MLLKSQVAAGEFVLHLDIRISWSSMQTRHPKSFDWFLLPMPIASLWSSNIYGMVA